MERIWNIAAAICLTAAFVFFWYHNFDGIFVAAVLGCVFWLLSYRAQTRRRVNPENKENEEN